jgi:hypothetical protein
MNYNYGLGKIYTVEEIDKAKQSPDFEYEYIQLKVLGKNRECLQPIAD